MPTGMIRQTMFTWGEVDQVTWKRTDIQEYLSAAQSLKNCEVGTTGLAKKRRGMEKILDATGYADSTSRLFEFIDKYGNRYIVMASNLKFYIFNVPDKEVFVSEGINEENQVVTGDGYYVTALDEDASLVATVDHEYPAAELDNLDYTQDNDAIIFSHPNYPPARLYIDNYNSNPYHFTWVHLVIYPYPAFDFNNVDYNNFTVALSAAGNVLTFQFTGLTSDPGFGPYGSPNPDPASPWVGGQIIGGGTSPSSPIGSAIITSVTISPVPPAAGPYTVTFTANIQQAFDVTPDTYAKVGSQYSVKQVAWSQDLGWPSKVLFYQNRLWFANSASLSTTVFGSKINKPINFDVGVGNATDAIIYSIGQNNSGPITWLNGGKQLEIFSENYEFAAPQNEDVGLTPSTFSIRQQSSYGVSTLFKPITYLNDSYYVSKTGKSIINFRFTGVGLSYQASNISAQSNHLVKSPINRALQRGESTSQDNFIYFLNQDDDTLTSFQFAAETKLAALTPLVFQTDSNGDSIVELIDIVTVNNEVYILKYYTESNQYNLERFNDNYRIDAARVTTINSSGLITGLTDLANYTAQVVYQGQDYGEWLVDANGNLTIDGFVDDAGDVTVGLQYTVELTPMYLYAGAQVAPFFKEVTRIYVDYYESLDFEINGKPVPYFNFATIQEAENNDNLIPQTDTAIIDPVLGWNRFKTFSITQSSPFDLQILSIGYQIASTVI